MRTKITIETEKSKSGKNLLELLKLILPLVVALIVALIGWHFTDKYNSTQLTIAAKKNEADLEVSKTNAAMQYIEAIHGFTESDSDKLKQIQMIVAPILPTELAFDIAFQNIQTNPQMFTVLTTKYKFASYKYCALSLCQFPYELESIHGGRYRLNWFKYDKGHLDDESIKYYATLEEKDFNIQRLLKQMQNERLLAGFYNYLISDTFPYSDFRDRALFHYFHMQRDMSERRRTESTDSYKLNTYIKEIMTVKEVSDEIKLAVITSLLLNKTTNSDFDTSAYEAFAHYFWYGYNVELGEHPLETELRQILYETYPTYKLAYSKVSEELFLKLSEIDYTKMNFNRVRWLLYYFAEQPSLSIYTETGGYEHKPYLSPIHIKLLVEKILSNFTLEEEKTEIAWYLGSLSGDILIMNVCRNDKVIGKVFSEMLLQWYDKNDGPDYDWPPPKFFHEIAETYPEFKPRIDKLQSLN